MSAGESGSRSRETRRETEMNDRATLRRAAAVLGTLLLVALVAPFVVFAVPQLVGADHGFVVLSGSMEPAMSPGDVIIVDAGGAIAVGDVITFQRGGDVPTTHRVVDVVDGAYRTKGDANENTDAGLVEPAQVLGRVVFVIPLMGYVVMWANTTTGFVLLVVVPLVVLVGLEGRDWLRGRSAGPAAGAASSDGSEEPAAATAEPAAAIEVVGVSALDVTLTFWTLLAFTLYAAWVAASQWEQTGTLGPLAVAVFTGAFVALLMVTFLAVGVRVNERRGGDTADAATPDPDDDRPPAAMAPDGADHGDEASEATTAVDTAAADGGD